MYSIVSHLSKLPTLNSVINGLSWQYKSSVEQFNGFDSFPAQPFMLRHVSTTYRALRCTAAFVVAPMHAFGRDLLPRHNAILPNISSGEMLPRVCQQKLAGSMVGYRPSESFGRVTYPKRHMMTSAVRMSVCWPAAQLTHSTRGQNT